MTIGCLIFLNMYLCFSSCVINCNFLDLQNYLLNGKTSYLRSVVKFKHDQKIICPSLWYPVRNFSKTRSNGVHQKGCDLPTLLFCSFLIDALLHFLLSILLLHCNFIVVWLIKAYLILRDCLILFFWHTNFFHFSHVKYLSFFFHSRC